MPAVHRAAAWLRHVADQEPAPTVLGRLSGETFEEPHQVRMPPITVARLAHHLPGLPGSLGFASGGRGSGLTLPKSCAAAKFAASSEGASRSVMRHARPLIRAFRRVISISECEL